MIQNGSLKATALLGGLTLHLDVTTHLNTITMIYL